jgi:hypothetical protein
LVHAVVVDRMDALVGTSTAVVVAVDAVVSQRVRYNRPTWFDWIA